MAPSSCDWVSSTARISFIWLFFFFFPPLIYQNLARSIYPISIAFICTHIKCKFSRFFFFTFFSFSISHRSPRPLPCVRLLLASQLFAWLLCVFFRELRYRIIINGNGKKSKQRREKASTRERRNIKRSGAEKRDVEKESQRRSFVIESILCIESSSSQIIGGKKGA